MHRIATKPIDTRPATERRLTLGIAALAIALLAAMALPACLGRVYVADDLGEFHLPLRQFYAQQLQRGEPFDWMPTLFAGLYLTGEGQAGVYHPLHLLIYRTLPLATAWNLEVLLSYPLLLWGMYLLLQRHLERPAAMAGAAAATFSGFMTLHFVHVNAVAVVAHWPWLCWAIDGVICGSGRRRVLAASLMAIVIASMLLIGYPQYVWLGGLLALGYTAWAMRDRWAEDSKLRLAAWLGCAAQLGALMAAVQLLPTLDMLGASSRAEVSAEFSHSGSLHPLNLGQLLAPYLFTTRVVGDNTHELGLYAGAATLLLALWAVAQRGRYPALDRIAAGGLGVAIIGLLLALGEYGPFGLAQAHLPLVKIFRFPCRAISLVHFGLAITAACGLAALCRVGQARYSERRPTFYGNTLKLRCPSRWLMIPFIASAVISLAAPFLWPDRTSTFLWIAAGPLLLAAAAALIYAATTGRRWAIPALMALLVADLGAYGLTYAVWPGSQRLDDFVATAALPPDENPRVALPDAADGLRFGNRILLAGATRVDGYAGLEPATSLDREQFARLAGARWRRSPDDGRWQPIERPVARARFLDDENATAEVIEDRPGRIAVRSNNTASQTLALTERFHSGWTVVIDGEPADAMCVHAVFVGCIVPPGEHVAAFTFQPASLRYGRWLSLFGLGLWGLIFAVGLGVGSRFARRT